MKSYTCHVFVGVPDDGTGSKVLRLIINEFQVQSIKPESLRQLSGAGRFTRGISITILVNSETEYGAWQELESIVKKTIDPAIEKSGCANVRIDDIHL